MNVIPNLVSLYHDHLQFETMYFQRQIVLLPPGSKERIASATA